MVQKLDTLIESPSQTAGPYVHIGLMPTYAGNGGYYQQEIGTSPIAAWEVSGGRWVGLTMLSAAAFLCLPRMFQVMVVENQDDCVHITLPATPKDHSELSDMELSAAAGGCLIVFNSQDHTQPGAGCTGGGLKVCNG